MTTPNTDQSVPAMATPNVDPAELDKFQKIAAHWWDPHSEFGPLHAINPLRLGWIQSYSTLRGQKVLDVGCGGGILAEAMAQAGAQVTGIDLAEKSLQVAKLHLLESQAQVRYECIAAEALAQREAGQFDVVTCMEMLEHVPEPESIVRACAALAKPNGLVVFSTINRNPKAYLFAVIGAERILRMLPAGTHEYDKFIKPSELGSAARAAGLDLVGMTGLTYNPLSKVYALNDRDMDVNYFMAFRKGR